MEIKVKKNKAIVAYDENDRNRYILTTFGDVCDLDKKILTKQNIENINLLYLKTNKLKAELLRSIDGMENKKDYFQLDFGNYNFGLYLFLKHSIEINFWIGFDFSDTHSIPNDSYEKFYFAVSGDKKKDFSFDMGNNRYIFAPVKRGTESWHYLPIAKFLCDNQADFQNKIIEIIRKIFNNEEHII